MSEKLYYTIGEVSEMFGINASVVRFWETEFPQINPQKGARGVRRYTPESVEVIRRIYHLTRECGFTLSGAKDQLKADGKLDEKLELVETLTDTKAFLLQLKDML